MVAWYYIDKHSCIAVFIGAFHFDGEKHDAKFKTDSTQSKLNNYQKINYIQSTFGKRFSTERGGHLFETQFHTSTSMIQISPQPSLRLVGNKSNINYYKPIRTWIVFIPKTTHPNHLFHIPFAELFQWCRMTFEKYLSSINRQTV